MSSPPPSRMRTTLGPEQLTALAQATLHDRAVGVLVGSALGDAIGLYTEFLSARRAASEYPSRKFTLLPSATQFAQDFHRLKHRPGEWTDDTDHSLLILLSYLHSGELDPSDLAARLRVWVDMGLRALDTPPLGLGQTVGTIVRNEDYLTDPVATAHDVWRKSNYNIAPNGSLMRTHPLGVICIHHTLDETYEIAARYSRVTHVDPRCAVACMAGTALIRGLLRGEVTDEAQVDFVIAGAVVAYGNLEGGFRANGPNTDGEPGIDTDEFIRHATAASLADLDLDGKGIGYVLKTFGSGILLLRQAMRRVAAANRSVSAPLGVFEPLITDLIMCGGDADTNACFAGALLGAYLGYRALPPQWRDGLRHGEWLLTKAEALCIVLDIREGSYNGKEDKDTHPDGGRGFLTPQQVERKFMELQARMAEDAHKVKLKEEEAAKKRAKESRTGWFGGFS